MSSKSRSRNHTPSPNPSTTSLPTTSVAVHQTDSSTPPLYNADEGKKALDAIRPRLEGIDEADVVPVRVDVEPAILAMLAVAGHVQSPAVHARFARLPKDDFDMECVDGLSLACFATLYALAEARAAGALETEARIPANLSVEAGSLKRRMRTACEYHLSDDAEIRPQLALLRPGTGHLDDANDLNGYARIYELRHDVLKSDTKHYRAGDAARAKELAGLILQSLSQTMTPKARAAYGAYVRCWTLAHLRYDEVRDAGLWLFRHDAHRDERFPSIYAVGRPNGGRPRKRATTAESASVANAGAPNGATPAGAAVPAGT